MITNDSYLKYVISINILVESEPCVQKLCAIKLSLVKTVRYKYVFHKSQKWMCCIKIKIWKTLKC